MISRKASGTAPAWRRTWARLSRASHNSTAHFARIRSATTATIGFIVGGTIEFACFANIQEFLLGWALCSPSPRTSPLARGGNALRLWTRPHGGVVRTRLAKFEGGRWNSVSPRERVGV